MAFCRDRPLAGRSRRPHVFLLTGEPGIGKTAVAARLLQFSAGDEPSPDSCVHMGPDFLSAAHFCSARNGGWIAPDSFTRSLSAQLAHRYPAFADALVSDPRLRIEQHVGTNMGRVIGAQITHYYADNPEALFDDLVRLPLHALCQGSDASPLVILVDGLDEALSYSGRVSIVRLLAACDDLPAAVRLLLTSRPVNGVLTPFRPLEPALLDAHGQGNREDLRRYARQRFHTSKALQRQAPEGTQIARLTESLARRSTGNFLVLCRVLDGIERGELSLDDPEALPAELHDLYALFLDRLMRGEVRRWQERYRPLLSLLAVAQEPVDAETLGEWAGWTLQRILDVLHKVRELLDPALDGRYRLYHQSIVDFLTGDGAGPHTLVAADSHRRIPETCVRDGVNWSACPVYALRYLPLHLAQSGQHEALRNLLLDWNWLKAKLNATDIFALLADFDLLASDEDAQLLQSAIRLSIHVLVEDPVQLAGQILGRLLSNPSNSIQALLAQAGRWKDTPWLRPMTTSLISPYGSLLHILKGHTGAVTAVVVTPDGKQTISASSDWALSAPEDKTLRVWDLSNGETVHTLEGHKAQAYAVVVTPDGKQAISASEDKTLRMWDLSSGQLVARFDADGSLSACAVAPDGVTIVAGEETGRVHFLRLEGMR